MKKTAICVLGGVTLAAAWPAMAADAPSIDAAAVQRCRIIAESAARLACYDAIALPGLGSRAGWGAPVGPAAAATATPGPGVDGSAASAPGAEFGLEGRVGDRADSLTSRIAGTVQEFGNGTKFTLENGQVWQIVDSTSGFYNLQNPPVRIDRALLGSFLMTIEGVNQRPRVRRIR